MKIFQERAFVLHRRPWSETSLILDFFCEESGRIKMISKGAYRSNSNIKSIAQAFTPLIISWSGRGEIKTLNKAEAISKSFPLSKNSLYCGIYVNELLIRVLKREIPTSYLFPNYFRCLKELSCGVRSLEPSLRRFELTLLKELGYDYDFLSLIKKNENSSKKNITFSFRKSDWSLTMDYIRKKESFTIEDIKGLWEQDFPDKNTLSAAKRFTRIALRPHLGSKPLKSRDLFLLRHGVSNLLILSTDRRFYSKN
jgi:DNA repair protein RecO (recombination protein O)